MTPLPLLIIFLSTFPAHFAVELEVKTTSEDDLSSSLCLVPGCDCVENPVTGFLDVSCSCPPATQKLVLGPPDKGSLPPHNTGTLTVQECQHVEIASGVVNNMEALQNITIKNTQNLVLHPHLYRAKGSTRKLAGKLENIEISHVKNLMVKRFSFKDMEITNRFYLGEVKMSNVVSLAFTFSYVKEFSVFASIFDRISMFGIKLGHCEQFNVLGMTHFTSLAAHAIKVKCDKFSLAYNWFGRLHDSSFEIEYGLCDIQGNTFVSLGGKPFLNMRPMASSSTEIAMSGLVFRVNKFMSEPSLPFGSLAMPSFSLLSPESSYVDIEGNQFNCDCQAIGWLIAFGKYGLNTESLKEIGATSGPGTPTFVAQMYNTAGHCLESEQGLGQFAEEVLSWNGDTFTCGEKGLEVRNRDKAEEVEKEDEESETSDSQETEHIEEKGEESDELMSDNLKSDTKSESEYAVAPPPDRKHLESMLLESESGRTPVKSSRKMGERAGANIANHLTFRPLHLFFLIIVLSCQNM